jgi:transcriptional regulator with XRE-family HTH domain
MSNFSNNLRFLRQEKGLNLDDFESLGIKKGTMSNYELGNTEPKLDTLHLLSNFFNISLDKLVCGDLKSHHFSKNPTSEITNFKGKYNDNSLDTQENQRNNIAKGENNIVASGNSTINAHNDNRQYYSDSPDVLRAQVEEKDRLLKEKDERLREKDERLREKDEYILELKETIKELKNK